MSKNSKQRSVFSMDKDVENRSKNIISMLNSAIGLELKDIEQAPPFSKWLNGKIRHVKRGEIQIEFTVRREMQNPAGLFHGGMQSALMDDIIGMTSITLGHEGFMLTIDLHVDFIGKAHVGDTVIVSAKIEREGKSVIHATAEIIDFNGGTVATANANLLKTSYKFL